MKNIISFFLLFVMFIVFHSCQSDRPEQIAKVSKVMEIHDDVMPKMDQIVSLQEKVEDMIAEMNNDSLNIDKRQLERAQKVLNDLKEADVAMWDWMNAFKMPAKDDPRTHSEIMEYLDRQQTSIVKVRDMMLSSIDSGQKLLKEYE